MAALPAQAWISSTSRPGTRRSLRIVAAVGVEAPSLLGTRLVSWPNRVASSMAPTAMTPSTMIPMVPAPARTAGMVNTRSHDAADDQAVARSGQGVGLLRLRGERGWSGEQGGGGCGRGPPFLSGYLSSAASDRRRR